MAPPMEALIFTSIGRTEGAEVTSDVIDGRFLGSLIGGILVPWVTRLLEWVGEEGFGVGVC
jgi:hypothetical protein